MIYPASECLRTQLQMPSACLPSGHAASCRELLDEGGIKGICYCLPLFITRLPSQGAAAQGLALDGGTALSWHGSSPMSWETLGFIPELEFCSCGEARAQRDEPGCRREAGRGFHTPVSTPALHQSPAWQAGPSPSALIPVPRALCLSLTSALQKHRVGDAPSAPSHA